MIWQEAKVLAQTRVMWSAMVDTLCMLPRGGGGGGGSELSQIKASLDPAL